jgi:hypothetical protein
MRIRRRWFRVLIVVLTASSAALGAGDRSATVPMSPVAPIAPGCPPTGPDRGTFPFPIGPASTMVPDGATSATACRYRGLNPPDRYGRLEVSNALTDAQLQQLTANLNAVGPNVRPGTMNCPYDDGQSDVVVFNYPEQPTVYVTVELLGCAIASNGTVRSMLGGAPESPGAQALTILASVVGPPTGPRN